jgi:Asp-tRNA(Asn)/Glu-tRNA(Gln) amidotransferase A subunit family amidase
MFRISAAALTLAVLGLTMVGSARQAPFQIEEATVRELHAAMRDGRLTCRALVAHYLKRIDAYDQTGPALNAIVVRNPSAMAEAEAADQRMAGTGPTRPLDCIPAIVKDNFETIGLQSAGGSKSLEGFVSDKDAFQVRKIKEAGAIVLAKSNMDEFAFSPYQTLSSIQGHTKNPYALDRVPAGSSGGTAAAVAASLGAIGLGSDTGNSIRGPSSHNALVGIRSTMGLTSRAGVIPLSFLADVAGPMTRTVEDAAIVLQAIAGEDPEDPMTARVRGRTIPRYTDALVADGLRGARIGVLGQAWERGEPDAEIRAVFEKALADLRAAGAEVIDVVEVEDVPQDRAARGFGGLFCLGAPAPGGGGGGVIVWGRGGGGAAGGGGRGLRWFSLPLSLFHHAARPLAAPTLARRDHRERSVRREHQAPHGGHARPVRRRPG